MNHISASFLHTHYGLSPAEAQITLAIVAGRSLEMVAMERAVSLETVRGQLKAIFRKTGATSQARLVALILRPG